MPDSADTQSPVASSPKPRRRFFLFTPAGVSLLFTLATIGVALVIYSVFHWLYSGPTEQFNIRNETVKTALQMFAGFFFVVTAFFSLRTVKATESNARAANRNAEAANENARIANENAKTATENLRVAQQKLDLDRQTTAETRKTAEAKQTSEQFFKATENLSGDKALARMGAIYRLEQIAHDSKQDFPAVLQVLGSFIMQATLLKAPFSPEKADPPLHEVQAAILTIGRLRANMPVAHVTHLSKCNLAHIVFTDGIESGRRFNYNVVFFNESVLYRAYARNCDFVCANFVACDLRKAVLISANCTEADFTLCKLDGVDFTNAILIDADLRGLDLSKTIGLTQAQIDSAAISKTTRLPAGLRLPPPTHLEPDDE